jgi:dipeptidyl aminopeptidase/acylaminoacyl peptidase
LITPAQLDFACPTPQNASLLDGKVNQEVKSMRASCLMATTLLLSTTLAVQDKPASKPHQSHSALANKTQASPLDVAMHAMFGVRNFQQAAISPDGKRVAWVETLLGPGGTPSANSAIYVASLSAPSHPKRITAGNGTTAHEEHDVRWSPNSKTIAFLSDALKPGQLQLFVVDGSPGISPGPAKQLTHLKGFLSAPGWSPDGKTIALLFIQNAPRAAGPLAAETPDEGIVSDSYFEQRLTLVDASGARLRQISPADTYVYEFDWSPNSQSLAITSAKGNGDDNWYVAALSTIDAKDGAPHPIVPRPGMQIASPRWSPDAKSIAFIGGLMSDEPIPGGDVYVVPANGGSPRNITPSMKLTANSLIWSLDSHSIQLTGIADGQTTISRITLDGPSEVTSIWTGPERLAQGPFVPDTSLSADGKISAVIRESFSHPPEIWAGPMGDWKQITHRNSDLKPAWGEAKSIRWKSDDFEIQGWLIYPNNFDPSKRYPLVVYVHGGPAWAYEPSWPTRWDHGMALPSEGYFVLKPNPRGSYGQGEKFTQANVKDFGGGDFRDILSGVDAVIQSAPIDPTRVGITGWSYGGYMTMWAVTQSKRFRAAAAGAGLSDWLSYTGENKIDQWMTPYFGASVYDDPEVYAKSEPMKFIKNAKTPTLIVVGDSDGECPPPQSYEFWHGLKAYGVPTEFVIYPHEGHQFADPAHSRDVIERTVRWFDRYLPPTQ